MTKAVRRLTSAAAMALGLAGPFMVPTVAGVATWKIVLGALGAVLFGLGSRRDPAPEPGAREKS